MTLSAFNIRTEVIILFVVGSKGMMINTVSLFEPMLRLVAIPEYMLTLMVQPAYTGCANAAETEILTVHIHAAF